MVKPEISIIVPVYKVESYVRKCIESILAQTFQKFELILIDDGSPDACGAICDDYARIDERIQVVHQKNKGLSGARNAGISIARGRYLSFVDSDDWISKEMYSILYSTAETLEVDIVQCDFCMGKGGLDCVNGRKGNGWKAFTESGKTAISRLYGKNGLLYTVVWNKLYRKNLFQSLRFPEGRLHEDEFVNYKLFYRAGRVATVCGKLYFYRQRAGSIMHQNYQMNRLDKYSALEERMVFLRKHGEKGLYRKTLRSYILQMMRDYGVCREQEADKIILRKLYTKTAAHSAEFLIDRKVVCREKLGLLLFLIVPFSSQPIEL